MVELLKLGCRTAVIDGEKISLFKKGTLLRQPYYCEYEMFDNANGGAWIKYIHIPIATIPEEDAQYQIVIDHENIEVLSVEGQSKTSSGYVSEFWSLVKPDGSDIRVFDENYRQLYFWIETFDYNNQHTEIWVKLPRGCEELNIAFGNSLALKSSYENGDKVFEFFDDFEGESLDLTKWNTNCSEFSIENSIIKFWGDWDNTYYYLNTKRKFPSRVVIIGKGAIGQVGADTDLFIGFRYSSIGVFTDNGIDCVYDGAGTGLTDQKGIWFEGARVIATGGQVTDTEFHKFRIIFTYGEIRFWDDLLWEISGYNQLVCEFYLSIGADTDSSTRYGYLDYIAVAKLTDPAEFGIPKILSF